jgi:taurine dioxygenase
MSSSNWSTATPPETEKTVMSLKITPLADALGVEVTGVDLSGPVAPADVESMQQALRDHLVMVIRDQTLDPGQYLAATRLFGDTMAQHLTDWLMPEHPEIAVLDSRRIPPDENGRVRQPGSRDWHTDHTNHAKPPKITALYAVKLPSSGGDTGFANMHMAYDALPGTVQSKLSGMKTVNKIEDRIYVSPEDKAKYGVLRTHPLIRTHPETGRKAIYIHPGKTARFEGMEAAESKVFMDDLMDSIIRPEICYRHKWRVGDLLMCDNRAVLHLAYEDYDPSEGRIMHRIILEGDVPA